MNTSTANEIPRYALRREFGVWELTFAGRRALLKQEQGLVYVAWLLGRLPGEPVHALDVIAATSPRHGRGALAEVVDSNSGRRLTVDRTARVEERSLSFDRNEASRTLLARARELQAVLDSDEESEPVKNEAMRELEEIAAFERQAVGRLSDSARRAGDSVRKAMRRFHARLLQDKKEGDRSNPVLADFAEHVERFLLVPSRRYAVGANGRSRAGVGGCLVYEPPPGIRWEVRM